MSPSDEKWERIANGQLPAIAAYRLASFAHFHDFLEEVVYASAGGSERRYIWRGHRRDEWSLNSSLDRLFRQLGVLEEKPEALEKRAQDHLSAFKYATRGRRGPSPQELSLDNEWWALGQHYGLSTPLLDWTRSPFAAAYFAFEELDSVPSPSRVVFALDEAAVSARNSEIENGPSLETGRPPILDLVDPFLEDNPRLVSQGGLFTRAPIGMSVEDWIRSAIAEAEAEADADVTETNPLSELPPILIRIEIPGGDRNPALRVLNRMNIHHLSLYPDLSGASRYTNLDCEIGFNSRRRPL